MYAAGVLLLAAGIMLSILSEKVDELFAMGDKGARGVDNLCHLARVGLIVVLGIYGNELRERNLSARVYRLQGRLEATSPEEALSVHKEQQQVKADQPD